MNFISPKILFVLFIGIVFSACNEERVESQPEPITVKVAVVYQNPTIEAEDGKLLHEVFGYNDPKLLNKIYKDSMEAVSHGSVKYEIVEVIEEDRMWTRFKDSTEYLGKKRVYNLLSQPGFEEFKEKKPKFDYKAFTDHYNFRERRDKGEINEVWVWTWPYAGMYESQQMGKEAFWCNSPPIKTNNEKILTVMGFNYERTADLAMHSFGHRAESVLRKVYDRWKPINEVEEPNNWELFTSLNKDAPGKGHVGNCHYPVNGESDYEYANETVVNTYADVWNNYPNLEWAKATPKEVNCEAWDCSQMGYMSWWYRKFPHFEGLNPDDQKLNNWWHYIVNYEQAKQLEEELHNS